MSIPSASLTRRFSWLRFPRSLPSSISATVSGSLMRPSILNISVVAPPHPCRAIWGTGSNTLEIRKKTVMWPRRWGQTTCLPWRPALAYLMSNMRWENF